MYLITWNRKGFYFFCKKKKIFYFWPEKAETQILPKNIDILKSKMKRLSFQPNTVRKYSQTCSNNHLWITATCQQRPVWSHTNQWVWSLLTINLFHNPFITTTFFRSQVWPLYTGLTVNAFCFLFQIIEMLSKNES